jgi:hypothetical protein
MPRRTSWTRLDQHGDRVARAITVQYYLAASGDIRVNRGNNEPAAGLGGCTQAGPAEELPGLDDVRYSLHDVRHKGAFIRILAAACSPGPAVIVRAMRTP